MPTNGLVSKALSLISLFLAKGGRNGGIEEIVDVVSVLSNTLTERMLVGIQNRAGLGGVLGYLFYTGHA